MIERYTHPEMGRIWTDKHRFEVMLQVEILSCEALAQLGEIPKSAYREIKSKADFNVASIQRIEERTKHDVIAFVTDVAKRIGPAGKYVHKGLTSSDVLDTGLSVQMVEAADLLLANVDKLLSALAKQAVRHKETVMVGRTHGVHAEPTTFGLVLALFYDEIMRQRERLERARETVRVGKISGAVGTYAHLSPRVEAHVCKGLGLKPANISNQVVQRDRHAEYLCTLAVIGGTLDKIALEIRHLQRTEVLEAEEPFAKGQQGSSAMPH
ncbi:MAG: adenylosuccinate lyase, partial [Candidatus Omnitrophica bacterium]|nr:adenylosuccinate lyase [Candidatus Omnitrophota bacterium]